MAALTATFGADFSSFLAAVEKADLRLKGFEEDSKKVASSLARIGDSYNATRFLQQATLTAEAIERIGGTSKLTAKELERAGAMATEAVAKMQALGKDVPANLQKLADAAKPIPERLSLSAKAATLAHSAFGQLFAAFSAANLVQSAIRAVVNFGKAALDSAGKTADLADTLGVSTEAIQRWEYVAAQTGTTVDAFASSAFKLQTRLAGGADSVTGAVRDLGLTFQQLRAQAPEKQFDTVIAALERMKDTGERNRLAIELFGKSYEQIASAVAQGYTQLKDGAIVASDAQVRALADAGDAWDRFKLRVRNATVQVLGDTVRLIEARTRLKEDVAKDPKALGDFLATIPTGASNAEIERLLRQRGAMGDIQLTTQQTTAATRDYAAALAKARAEVAKLTPVQRAQLDAAIAMNAADEQALATIGVSAEAFKVYTTQVKASTQSLKQQDVVLTDTRSHATRVAQAYDQLVANMRQTDDAAKRNVVTLTDTTTVAERAARGYDQYAEAMAKADEKAKQNVTTLRETTSTTERVASAYDGLIGKLRQMGTLVEAGQKTFKFGEGFQKSLQNLGPTVMSALTGGGNVTKAVGGMFGSELGSTLSEGLTKNLAKDGVGKFTKAFGGMLSSALPGVGAIVGQFAGQLFGKLFGKSEHAKVNDMRDAAFGAAGGFEALNEKAHTAGFTLDRVLRAKTVKDYEAAIGELEAKLGSFAAEQAADQQRLNDAIQRYGFSLAELGPQLQSSRLNEQAKELIEDWRVLAGAGIDVATINAKMAESMNSYLQQALSFGAEVPNAMRPILEAMAKQGTLVDENGTAITDLESTGIKFSETMTEGFDRVVKKLDELIVKLQSAGSAIASIPKSVDVGVNYIQGSVPALDMQELPGYQTGTHGRYLDFKQGTAVQLHGRERVMTEAEGRADAAALARLADSIAGLDRRISQAVGRAVADAMILAPAR